jgi:hypothetical protein
LEYNMSTEHRETLPLTGEEIEALKAIVDRMAAADAPRFCRACQRPAHTPCAPGCTYERAVFCKCMNDTCGSLHYDETLTDRVKQPSVEEIERLLRAASRLLATAEALRTAEQRAELLDAARSAANEAHAEAEQRAEAAEETLANISEGRVAFHWVVDWLRRWLDANYPEGTIVCSGSPDADSGARFTWDVRRAIARLREFKGGDAPTNDTEEE